MQINHHEVYVLGGSKQSLLCRKYNVMHSCLHIDLTSGDLEEHPHMQIGRQFHAVCFIGHYIYVVGGRDSKMKSIRECERYDVLKNQWQIFASTKDQVALNKEKMRIARLDSFGGSDRSVLISSKRSLLTHVSLGEAEFFDEYTLSMAVVPVN